MRIQEIEQIFKKVFKSDGLVKTVDSIYEKPDNGDFLKLVISIHGLTTDDTKVIHTKFIFKVDKNKVNLISNNFVYLFDINCKYNIVDFEDQRELEDKLKNIIKNNDFGKDIQILSEFIEAPSMLLNHYMNRNNISEYSIFDVSYEPKFKTNPCKSTTFDFDINISDNYRINLSIRKSNTEDKYKLQFKFMEDISTIEVDTIKNIHLLIGSNIVKVLNSKLKNKGD